MTDMKCLSTGQACSAPKICRKLGYCALNNEVLRVRTVTDSKLTQYLCDAYNDECCYPVNCGTSGACIRARCSNEPDPVNHPAHYTSHPSGVECIQIAEHFGFALGNVIKYIWREGQKAGTVPVEDLKKARWYLDREISRREAQLAVAPAK